MFDRAGGLLLHLTSLPGGGIGPAAGDFLRFLEAAGQRWWQMLPVGPPGYGGSPYAALSAFAGNEALVRNGTPRERPVPRWLKEYAKFRALKDRYHGKPWWRWPKRPKPDPARVRHYVERQFAFDDGWAAFRRRAHDAGVRLLGDLPLFVAKDSADVWARRSLFDLELQSGVPPDYFNADGQLWGNPQYHWPAHKRTKFRWWVDRFDRMFELFDAVRIDHFLGLHRVWAVPRRARTARTGTWQKVPGAQLLEAVGHRTLIAENLGIVTPEAEALRARFGIPGMHVLQFSFGHDPAARPFWFDEQSVVYTGTHDNDTTRGWTREPDVERAARYLGCSRGEVPQRMLRLAWLSRPRLAIAPVQDLLALGTKARMNTPGTAEGNWRWKLRKGQLTAKLATELRALTKEAGR
ncbi:MAG: 4-alpha-glucanotransferase [Planctomycetota bacterium]